MAARTALCSSAIASSIETPADTSTAFAAALPSPLLTWATTVSRHAAAPGAAEVRLPLVAGDDAGLVADDRLHELVPAGKAVIHLRPSHTRRLDVTESGTRHAPLADQPRSAAQPHPRSARGPAPLGGEPAGPAPRFTLVGDCGDRIPGAISAETVEPGSTDRAGRSIVVRAPGGSGPVLRRFVRVRSRVGLS